MCSDIHGDKNTDIVDSESNFNLVSTSIHQEKLVSNVNQDQSANLVPEVSKQGCFDNLDKMHSDDMKNQLFSHSSDTTVYLSDVSKNDTDAKHDVDLSLSYTPFQPEKLCHIQLSSTSHISDEYISLHHKVNRSGTYNFIGCKCSVPTHLHIDKWRQMLQNTKYHDSIVCDLLDYGFPISYEATVLPDSSPRNHSNALAFPQFMDEFIQKEVQLGATLEPFKTNPLNSKLYTSPLNTVPKKGSENKRRIILDLSWPIGHAINDGIFKDS